MLFLVRDLIKLHIARLDRAEEGLLSGVNSEMIKEIVPLPEEFTTAFVVAREYLGLPTCGGACVFDKSKAAGARYVNLACKAA